MEYILIDKEKIIPEIFKSNDLTLVLHEFLSIVNNVLKIITSHNCQASFQDITFNHLSIVGKIIDPHKQYPLITDVITFNLEKCAFMSTYGTNIVLPHVYTFLELQQSISHHTHLLKNKVSKSKLINHPHQNIVNETHQLIKNLENIKPSTPKKSFIPIVEEKDKNIDMDMDANEAESDIEIDDDKSIESVIKMRHQMDSVILPKKNESSVNNVVIADEDLTHLDPKAMAEALENLKKLKEAEQQKLEVLKTQLQNDLENFNKYSNQLGNKQRNFKIEKDKEEERRRIFEADKEAYRRMKEDIAKGILSEEKISDLFIDKYPIFKFMDQKNLIHTEDSYIIYLNLYHESHPTKMTSLEKGIYVPHNIHYLSDEEKTKYAHIKESYKNDIDEFMTGKNTKNYPSIDTILSKIDHEDQITMDENATVEEFNSDVNFEEKPVNPKFQLISNLINKEFNNEV
jgi:hypothetical protein